MSQKLYSDQFINELVLTRTPVFSFSSSLSGRWDELKQYIGLASPDLFDLIRHASYEEYLRMPERVRLSVWKYFNRAKFRPTPYGPFASVAFVGRRTESGQLENRSDFSLKLERHQKLHEYFDWEVLYDKQEEADALFVKAVFLWTNSTIYRNGEAWRCLTRDSSIFTLIAVDYNQFLEDILSFCRDPIKKTQVCSYIQQQYEVSEEDTKVFLTGLVGMQILLTDRQPNITGGDYFSRIGWEVSEQHDPTAKKYIISERKVLEITGNPDYQEINQLIPFLHQTLSSDDTGDLVEFRKRFLDKFEYRNIPLMHALDPELGVGYGDMEDHEDQLPVKFPDPVLPGGSDLLTKANFSPLFRYILDAAMAGKPVQLERFDRRKLTETGRRIPNSMNAMIRPLDSGASQVEFIGGCTGNSLIGRFSIALEDLKVFGRQLAHNEFTANPDVIFTDVAYLGDKKADNINRRVQLYEYELPILTWSDQDFSRPLHLNDLYVTVQNEEVILTSKSLGKRIIPRVVSAYNYQRTELSLFRFFADLQYQGLQPGLSIPLQSSLPGLSHYPRVTYKNLLLSPAKWSVPQEYCKIASKDLDSGMQKFYDWLDESGIMGWVRQGIADQFLYFDLRDPLDKRYLFLSLQGCSGVYLEEFLMPAASLVTDETGAGYAAEHLLVIQHDQMVYQPAPDGLSYPSYDHAAYNQLYMTGDEWIYAELYLHPSRCNAVLQGFVRPLLKKWSGRLSSWFFVRYNQPSFHLRLRFKCKQKEDLDMLFSEINRELSHSVQDGTIRDIQWKPYIPELERYGVENLSDVEKCFSQSSRFVLSLLDQFEDIDKLYLSVARLFDVVFEELSWDKLRCLAFLEAVATNFVLEFKLDQTSFKAINKAAKDWLLIYRQDRTRISFLSHTGKGFANVIRLYPDEQQFQIMADLFHMHINRLFSASPRRHECLIYQYMQIALKAALYRKG